MLVLQLTIFLMSSWESINIFNNPIVKELNYTIDIYGTTFRLIEIWVIRSLDELLQDFFKEDYETLLQCRLSRADYNLDLFSHKKLPLPTTKLVLGKTNIRYSNTNNHTRKLR